MLRSRRLNRPALGLLVIVAVSTALAQTGSDVTQGGLVSTAWLAEHLPDSDLRVVDMRYGVKYYWQKHIPGAVFLHPDVLAIADRGVPDNLLPPELLAGVLGRLGIGPATTVVVYGEEADTLAPHLAWALDCLGHPNSAVLDGGLDRWLAEERPVTKDYPVIEPRAYPAPAAYLESGRAALADVADAVKSGSALLVDARTPGQYAGTEGPWKRLGHIPGAVNRPWTDDLLDGSTWQDTSELRREYAALGITPDRPVIVYCGKGLTASGTWFTLKRLLGFPDVRVYDGSFSEWADVDSLPVESGRP